MIVGECGTEADKPGQVQTSIWVVQALKLCKPAISNAIVKWYRVNSTRNLSLSKRLQIFILANHNPSPLLWHWTVTSTQPQGNRSVQWGPV